MEDNKLKEAFASLVKEGKREAVAQLLVEYVQPTHIATDFIGLLMNSRNLKPGDALVKKVRKGIQVRTLVPGAIHLASELTVSDRVNYVLDGADVKVTANEWELESGELGTLDDIRGEMLAKLRDFYMGKVFTALSTVWTASNTPDNFTNVGGALTSTALKNAIDRINQTTGGVKAVIGTRAALTPITTFGAGWADGHSTPVSQAVPENIKEIMQTGWLGRYYGAPIMAIEQQYNNPEDYTAMIPSDKVIVVGNNVGEFITYGDVKTKQWSDMQPTPPQWYLELYQQFGLIVDNAQGIYVIKVA
jgi:hypothetical protein